MRINIGDLLNLGYSISRERAKANPLTGNKGVVPGFGSQLVQRFSTSQFSNNLEAPASSRVDRITIRLPGEDCVYTGGIKGNRINQNVYVEYTDDSSADDPVVRISGEADSGSFDFVCHINDIDPRNASYAELSALYGHLVKTGEYRSSTGGAVTPYGYEFFGSRDMLKKQDFIAGISALSVSDRIEPHGRADAKYMLRVYQNFIQRS